MKTRYDEKLKDFICYGEELLSVVAVKAMQDYTLVLTFSNGEKRTFNVLPLLEKSVYKPLANKAFFLTAKIDGGTVVWNDDIDIAPENLYRQSKLSA